MGTDSIVLTQAVSAEMFDRIYEDSMVQAWFEEKIRQWLLPFQSPDRGLSHWGWGWQCVMEANLFLLVMVICTTDRHTAWDWDESHQPIAAIRAGPWIIRSDAL